MGKTLKEIIDRKLEIRTLLEGNSEVDLSALETELRDLTAEQTELETRQRLINNTTGVENIIIGSSTEKRTLDNFSNDINIENRNKYDSLEYRQAFMNYALRGEAIPAEYRAAGVTKTGDIGALIPQTVLNKIIEKIESSGMILSLVNRTAIKGGVSIPTSSVKPTAVWVVEGAGSNKQKKSLGASITFAYHKLRCAVAISLEVDVMSMSAFESALINNVVEAMTIALEESIINGTGSGQPKGILKEAPEVGQELSITKIEYQTLIDAEGALPLEYENHAVWCMTKKTFMAFAGMTDTNGQPIARVNYGITGKPERTLLGRNVVLCNYLDSYSTALEADKVFAFLFNFSDYCLNTNYSMSIKKYEDNETDDLVTKAIMIADGKVIQKNSLVTLKKAAIE